MKEGVLYQGIYYQPPFSGTSRLFTSYFAVRTQKFVFHFVLRTSHFATHFSLRTSYFALPLKSRKQWPCNNFPEWPGHSKQY
jgi:hypothetical protein